MVGEDVANVLGMVNEGAAGSLCMLAAWQAVSSLRR